MSARVSFAVSLLLIAAATAAGFILLGRLPDPMPSHWNAAGQVDGYQPKLWGVLTLPLVTLALCLLFAAIPLIDPLKANIARFRGLYNAWCVGLVVYLLYVHALTLGAALGYRFPMTSMLLPAVGLLLVGTAGLVRRAKRNFFIGIRTPWTLSSDEVWDRTHALGAWTFAIAGVLLIAAAFIGASWVWVVLFAVAVAALVPVVYSFILYQRLPEDRRHVAHWS